MNDQNKNHNPNSNDKAGKKTGIGLIKSFVLVTVASVVLMVLMLFVIDIFWEGQPGADGDDGAAAAAATLQRLRDRENQELSSYAVSDTVKGVYRIPIEKAMELTVEEAR